MAITNGGILKRTVIFQDKAPKLGGNLDANSKNITNIQDMTVAGDLTVSGTTTTLDTTNLEVADNVIVVNKGESGAGVTAGTAGFTVDRGSATDKSFLWNETLDAWDVGSDKIINVATPTASSDAATKGYVDSSALGLTVTNVGGGAEVDKTSGAATAHSFRTLLGGTNVTVTQNTNDITIASTDTNTTYSSGTGLSLTSTTFALDSAIGGLSDVSSTAASTGQVLKWSGTEWVPNTDLDTGEVNTASNLGSGKNVFKAKSGVDFTMRSLTAGSNVTLTENANDIEIASTDTNTTYSASTGLALTGTAFSLNSGIDGLSDVVITTAASDDVLQWNGSNWINQQIVEEGTTASNVGLTGASSFKQKTGIDLEFRKIKAGSNISITEGTNDIEIASTASGAVSSVNSATGAVTLDTDDIGEGSTNLYYTDTRADARITASELGDISDVATTVSSPTPSHNKVLQFRAASAGKSDTWEPRTLWTDQMGDWATIAGAYGGGGYQKALIWWDEVAYQLKTGGASITGLDDVDIQTTAPTSGQTLVWTSGLLGTIDPNTGNSLCTITAGGSGYTSPPTVAFSGGGGSGAAATAIEDAGVVTSITITNRGTGYTSAPTISFSGGGGSGTTATVTIGDKFLPGTISGGSSFSGDLTGNVLTDSTDSQIDTDVPIKISSQSYNQLWIENPLTAAGGSRHSRIRFRVEDDGNYNGNKIQMQITHSSDNTKKKDFDVEQMAGSSWTTMSSGVYDSGGTYYSKQMLRFDGGSVSGSTQIGAGIKAMVGMDITPVAQSDFATSNSTTFNLDNGGGYSDLRGHHFSQVGDSSVPVTILGGVGNWSTIWADTDWPGWGSLETFHFWYKVGGFSGATSFTVNSMLPIFSGGPDITYEDTGGRPSWIDASGNTTGLSTVGTASAFVHIEITFPNSEWDCIVRARKYGC